MRRMRSWVLGTKAATNCTVIVLGVLENMAVGSGPALPVPQPICKAWHHFLTLLKQAGSIYELIRAAVILLSTFHVK